MGSIQINIPANEDQQNILISQLSDLGAEGFEQYDDQLVAYFNENNFDRYEVNKSLDGYKYSSQTIPDQNWNEVWESNFQPVVINDFCGIRAEFHDPIPNIQYEIIITPKMSFGTGHHATTHMMVEQMSKMDFRNKTVFDFGTGTGILAILAEKLGAEKVIAIDVDDWSIKNSEENCRKNNCTKVYTSLSSNLPEQQFDIVLANINKNVILQYLPQLKKILKNDSQILFSGLLVEDEEDILSACVSYDIKLEQRLSRNNWISLLCVTRS
ncbi:MAG TPA: 50S ribosomal protein L11 methyltransferase [Flavisolibacter sp.]|nr:50S ribosomal protein L11 methyltransferase [Flavisolibacter sp.]